MTTQLAAIRIHPIKSTAALCPDRARVEPRGLEHDRRWMLVDDTGRFITGRQHPSLVRVTARPTDDGLTVSAPGRCDLRVARPEPGDGDLEVSLWRDRIEASDAGQAAADWFSDYLGVSCRLVHQGPDHRRPVDPDHSRPGDEVSFADGFPLLLISEASLAALNRRLQRPVDMARFRPNLVVNGCDPFAEDDWRSIEIGGVPFEAVKPCARCVFTTVDPATGERDPDGEPLATLRGFRSDPRGRVLFGQNLVARGSGLVQHGQTVRIMKTSAGTA